MKFPSEPSPTAEERAAALKTNAHGAAEANGAAVPGEATSTNGHAGSYDSPNLHKYTSGSAFYYWHLRQFMHQLYETVACTAPATVLDAGCGEGFVTRFLRRQNADWDLMGIDLSRQAIAYARRHTDGGGNGSSNNGSSNGTRYTVGDLYALPFEDDAFDTVLCSEVLEHLDEPDRAFRELRRVARRSVVVSVPREPYFQWLNDFGQALGLSPDPGHVNFWDEQGFRHFVHRHLQRPRFATKHIYQIARGRAA